MNTTYTDEEARHVSSILDHYAHAKEKHPYFCDIITCLSESGADTHLSIYRARLAAELKAGAVETGTLLMCEFYEAIQAYANGDTAHAVEECYDAIAVLLRKIDVLEGRQKLGKPETKDKKKVNCVKKKVNCVKCGESIPISKAEDWEVSGSTRRYICPSCAAEEAI